MTAETDALRLVPVNARDLDALRYVLNRADEASRIRTVMSTFTLPERETTADRLERLYATLKAAAPAVQPAAGRTLGQVAYEGWAQGLPGCEWSNQTATQKRAWEKAAQAVAALSQPGPASEGDGDA